MSRANAIELMGFVGILVGWAALAYACWLIEPILWWFFTGFSFVSVGTGLIWLGNGGFRR